jgi:hypothetical protein
MLREVGQRRLRRFAQRMTVRHDDAPMPAIAGQPHQVREDRARAGGDGDVDAIGGRELGDLFRVALVQVQADLGVAVAEFPQHLRQHVTCLRVRGGDGEVSRVVLAQVGRQHLDVARLAHDLRGAVDDLGSRVRGTQQGASLAFEDLEAELVLELLELLADARLRGVQDARGLRDVQVVLGYSHEVAQLRELHGRCIPLVGHRGR